MNTTLALVYTLLQQFKTIPCAIDIPFVQFFFPCTTIQKQFHAPSTSPSYNSFSPCTKRLEGAPAGIVQFFFTIPAGIVQFTYNTEFFEEGAKYYAKDCKQRTFLKVSYLCERKVSS